jgi:hypothetical protein
MTQSSDEKNPDTSSSNAGTNTSASARYPYAPVASRTNPWDEDVLQGGKIVMSEASFVSGVHAGQRLAPPTCQHSFHTSNCDEDPIDGAPRN